MKTISKLFFIIFIFLVLLVITACNQDQAQDMSTEEATEISLDAAAEIVLDQVVQTDTLGDTPVIVFAWPEPLLPGDVIHPFNKPGFEPFPEPTEIKRECWFFWVDDRPGAAYVHENRFVFVDRESGEVTHSEEEWWPVLNDQGLWVSREAYWDEANWIFSNVEFKPQDPQQTQLSNILVSYSPTRLLQQTSPGAALVINGWGTGEKLEEDMATSAGQMHNIFTNAGFDTTYYGPKEDKNSNNDGRPTSANRQKWLSDKAKTLKPSQTLFIYLTGHGKVKEDGSAFIDHVSETALKRYLEKFDKGVHIIVIIDSCKSGAYVDSLKDVADITITATDAKRASYGDIDFPGLDPNFMDDGMEFTSGFVENWNNIRGNEAKAESVKKAAEKEGQNQWEGTAAEAYKTAVSNDMANRLGWTGPILEFGSPQTKPTPTPIPGTSQLPYIDETQDGLNCSTGELSTTPISPNIDITSTWVVFDSQQMHAVFNIEFGEVDQVDTSIAGGIEFYYQGQPEITDWNWYFNTMGYNSANFMWNPPGDLQAFRAFVGPNGWEPATETHVTSSWDGTKLVITVPYNEIPPAGVVPMPESIFWFATATDFWQCDAAGEELILFITSSLLGLDDD